MNRLEKFEKEIKDMRELVDELGKEVSNLNKEVKETILYILAKDEESKSGLDSDAFLKKKGRQIKAVLFLFIYVFLHLQEVLSNHA